MKRQLSTASLVTPAHRMGWTEEDYAIAIKQTGRGENRLADIADARLMSYRTKTPKADRAGLEDLGLL